MRTGQAKVAQDLDTESAEKECSCVKRVVLKYTSQKVEEISTRPSPVDLVVDYRYKPGRDEGKAKSGSEMVLPFVLGVCRFGCMLALIETKHCVVD